MTDNAFEMPGIEELNEGEDYGIYKKYIGIWEQPNALDTLLDVVGAEEYIYKLTSTNFKKKKVWEEIARKIESRGILLGNNPCRVAYQKWLNLKKNYINLMNKKGNIKTPPWFGRINDIIEKSEGKLLGNASSQGEEEDQPDNGKEPLLKKMKQELLPTESEGEETGEVHVQIDPGQYIIEEVDQVSYGDVVAIMQQLEVERREREEAREKREQERFDKLAELLKQQNSLTARLITILSKQSNVKKPGDNHTVLPTDPTACDITADDAKQ